MTHAGEAVIKAALPNLSDVAPVYITSNGQPEYEGYDRVVPPSIDPANPTGPMLPGFDATKKHVIAEYANGLSLEDEVHEWTHLIEVEATLRGHAGYYTPFGVAPTQPHDAGAFQEKLWTLLGNAGTYREHWCAAGTWASKSEEWFAEIGRLVFTPNRIGGYASLRANPGGGRAPDYGEPDVVAFFTGLTTRATQPATPTPPPAPSTLTFEDFGPIPGSNFMAGREGNPVTLVIEHWMDGTLASANARFHDATAKVSAHFGVSRDGATVQWVSEADTAYHAGDWNTNLISIGIEHEVSPTMPPTDALYAASARLHSYLSAKYNIRLESGVTVKPHRAIVPTACPGTLDIDRIVAQAGGVSEVPFKDDPDAQAFAADVHNSLEAIKAELAKQAHHKHPSQTVTVPESGEPEAA